MNGARLKSLVIENFRSLRGKVVVPLDAQVVLIDGTNGMGKTSVLSAIELGLTGKVAHLADEGDAYKSYLTTLDTGGGSITLTTTTSHRDGGATEGSLIFSDKSFTPDSLLNPVDARFFAERCYLPQAALGRLLTSMTIRRPAAPRRSPCSLRNCSDSIRLMPLSTGSIPRST